MQQHRVALARRGGTRTVSPVARAAQILHDEMKPDWGQLLSELAEGIGAVEVLDLRIPQAVGDDQTVLFIEGLVTHADGSPLDLGHEDRLRLAAYLRRLGLTGPIPLPREPEWCARLRASAIAAEHLYHEEARRRARAHVSENLVDQVSDAVHRRWVADGLAALRSAMTDATENTSQNEATLFDTDGLVPRAPRSS